MISGNPKYIKDIEFNGADDFLKAISYGGELRPLLSGCIFRGHYSDKYQLVPYLLRKGVLESFFNQGTLSDEDYQRLLQFEDTLFTEEYWILRHFFNKADRNGLYIPNVERIRKSLAHPIDEIFIEKAERWLPEEFWELAALAQHYGLPTRLLDWSYDIYTSLYFATYPLLYESKEIIKEILLSSKDNNEDATEGKIEIWALRYVYLSGFVIDNRLEDCPLKVIRPYYAGNPNLAAQKGLFTLWQVDKSPFVSDKVKRKLWGGVPLDKQITDFIDSVDADVPDPVFYRITLPKREIPSLLFKERNAADLFPGYAGVCRAIDESNRLSAIKDLLLRNKN